MKTRGIRFRESIGKTGLRFFSSRGSRCGIALHPAGLLFCVAVMGFSVLASRGFAAEPTLKPRLLFDADEIAAYLNDFPKDDYQVAEVPGLGRFYIDDNPALVKKVLLRGKPWDTAVIKLFEEHLKLGDIVLDIGAHIGSLTVAVARIVGPNGRVYAFEPQKKIYRELVHNLKLNELKNVVPLRFALSAENQILEMNPVVNNDGQVSLGKGGDKVEARTIDSFGFSDIALMKIDVEGHETEVLHGAERTIRALHPVIIIETWGDNYDRVAAILGGYGYTMLKFSRMDYLAIYNPKADLQP